MRSLLAALAAALVCTGAQAQIPTTTHESRITCDVRFSPRGGISDAIVTEIGRARGSILVASYEFTSAPIADALIAAHARGVMVQVVTDRTEFASSKTQLARLHAAGIPVSIDTKHKIHHSKYLVIDHQTLITGSYNFTASAENLNSENSLVCTGSEFQEYTDNWQRDLAVSVPAQW